MHRFESATVSAISRRQGRRHRRFLLDALERRQLFDGHLVISEFVASNSSGLIDSFGDRSDWVEIYNRGDANVDLRNYFLTDDAAAPNKWRFPTQNLSAGGYLIVYASDRNVAIAGQQLHTNFKLGAGGEYLGLINVDGTVEFEYAPAFPAQTADISYGLTDENDPASARQFFGTPTPGAVNTAGAATPIFSVPGKIITTATSVTLSSPTPGAQIRYTLDRSEPTANSPLYTAPIALSSTRMIRAKTFAPGFVASAVVGQSYVFADSTVANFNTNVGTVVIDTYGQGLNDTNMVLGTGTFIDNAGDGRSSMTDIADYNGRIGVRIRGSSSQDSPKKALAVELWDEKNNDRKAALLGMPADSDWILYAPYMEKSLLQNALAFGWGAEAGLLAPRLEYVEVYLNTDGGTAINYASDYVGLYILMEKIKVNENRVDIAEITPNDNTEPAVTGGYLWKKDRIEADETVVTTNSGQPFVMVDPETLTAAQTTWLRTHLNNFEATLNGANYQDPINGYAKYIDVDSWIDNWLMIEMTKQIDGYRLSSFYYKDRGGKIKMGPMWDYNLSLGNAWYANGSDPSNYYTDQLNDFDMPYMRRLMTDPAFKQKTIDRWAELRRTSFTTAKLMADIDARVAEITDNTGNYPTGQFPTQVSNNAVVRNFKRWSTQGVWNWPNGYYDRAGRWIEDVGSMKDWLIARVNWLDSKLTPAPLASVAAGYKTSPISVVLTPYRTINTDTTLIGPNAAVKAIIPTADISGWADRGYPAIGWLSGVGGVGYDNNVSPVDFNPLIGINTASMFNSRLDVYTRYEFNVADPAAIDALILKLKYDDGFVAYLNGVRITSDNDSAAPDSGANPNLTHWNNNALSSRDDNQAIVFREFDVSAFKRLLVAGTNVLAIQGMNNVTSSSDLLIVPELVSRVRVGTGAAAGTQIIYTLDGTDPLLPNGQVNPAAFLYSSPIAIASTARLRARSLTAGVWSAIVSRYYNFEPDALRVGEIMYNPAPPAAGSPYTAQDFEFVELRNASSDPLNLEGYAFADGIEFTFPNVTIPAGGVGVIVANLAAFQSRYGTGITPIGVYSGALDNAGDTLLLNNPFGNPSQNFTYDDAWYPTTDGGGASLEVNGPATLDLNLSTSWRASLVTNGTPGIAIADTTPPTASNPQYLFETSPNKVTFQFSEDIGNSFVAANVTVMNLTTGLATTPASISFDAATRIGTIVFAAGPMIDGNYRVTLNASGITDAAGNKLDGDSNGKAGDDLLFDFFSLAGDANRDRRVDFADLVILAQNYNLAGKTFSQGNFDYLVGDTVDFADLVILAQKYNTSLLALPTIVAPPLTKTTTKGGKRPNGDLLA